MAADDDLTRAVVVGQSQTWPCAAASATARAASMSRPSSAAIAPSPTGTACCIAWPRRLTSRAAAVTDKRARRRQRRIFAQRMAGDIGGLPRDIEPSLAFEHANHRKARREQRRLRVLGQHQLVFRALEHQPREMLRQRLVDLLEQLARRGNAAASAWPMPGACDPCPGKTKARFIPGASPSPRLRPS